MYDPRSMLPANGLVLSDLADVVPRWRAIVASLALFVMTGCIEYFAEPPRLVDRGPTTDASSETPPDTGALGPDGAVATEPCQYQGETYDCEALDPCDEGALTARVACCQCDQRFCSPANCDELDLGMPEEPVPVESCMTCHNGARSNDYSGAGLLNPHPFAPASSIRCTGCHGGDPTSNDYEASHVPAPPAIGDRSMQAMDFMADRLRWGLVGVDRLTPDPYPAADGRMVSNLDYLQFINPGDLRVVSAGRGCGARGCHGETHGEWVPRSLHATTTGIFSATRFAVGVSSRVPENRDPSELSLAETAPRAVESLAYTPASVAVGEVARLLEQPVRAAFDGPLRQNVDYLAGALADDVITAAEDPERPARVREGSALEVLLDEQLNQSCGSCHLYGAGRNNTYALYRSTGCTACHMEYAPDGKYRGADPNIRRDEPASPDSRAAGERAHVAAHRIHSVAQELPDGTTLSGISDRACATCHSSTNQTVLQYWGIRVDRWSLVATGGQYPADPGSYTTAEADRRLFSPGDANNTYSRWNSSQLLLREDYDADGADDTPPDIHHERGLGCIDCHGGSDLHGGASGDERSGRLFSRQDQVTRVSCESCHGIVERYAETAPCITRGGLPAECALDRFGHPLDHVTMDAAGHYWLISRADGRRHYVPQTRDLVVLSQRRNPDTASPLYRPAASYAMGRADGNPQTGTGPIQSDGTLYTQGFSHLDTMECSSCHAAWSNNCIGCHLSLEYNVDPNNVFSSEISGERILLREDTDDAVYQSPVMQYLGVNSRRRIARISPVGQMFWRYTDQRGDESEIFVFSDRSGEGNNPARRGRNDLPAIAAGLMAPHTIRGRPDGQNEGPIACVGCHLNVDMMESPVMQQYDAFVAAYEAQDFANIDFSVLEREIGQNPGNQRNSPFFVRMMVGLGTGLFLFDRDGCPVNPLDGVRFRDYCRVAPASQFAEKVNEVRFDLDRFVESSGVSNASTTHPMQRFGGAQRAGANNPSMAGPLGAQTIQRLIGGDDIRNGLILDSWFDANGRALGDASRHVD